MTYTLYLVSSDGWRLLDSMTIDSLASPLAKRLLRFHPNPCLPHATISFSIARAQQVSLAVSDLAGRRVALLAGGLQGAGERTVRWRGLDTRGRQVPSGVYLVRLTTQHGVDSRKLLLLR